MRVHSASIGTNLRDVTSGSSRCYKFRNVRYQISTFKMADPAGTETVEEAKKRRKDTPSPRENTPPQKYPRNRRAMPSSSEDVPANSGSRRMAQKM